MKNEIFTLAIVKGSGVFKVVDICTLETILTYEPCILADLTIGVLRDGIPMYKFLTHDANDEGYSPIRQINTLYSLEDLLFTVKRETLAAITLTEGEFTEYATACQAQGITPHEAIPFYLDWLNKKGIK
jgi:hypothetical protein